MVSGGFVGEKEVAALLLARVQAVWGVVVTIVTWEKKGTKDISKSSSFVNEAEEWA